LLPIFLVQVLLFQLAVGQQGSFDDLDPNDNFSEDDFNKFYHKDKPASEEEYVKRARALKKHEQEIKDVNEKFKKGEISWSDKVNKYSDLPADEFISAHTGANIPKIVEGRGLKTPLPEQLVDLESEIFFASMRMNRDDAPDSYSAVDEGLVSPVKSQGDCGSCVAFATGAAVETCFKKVTGSWGDVSEQHFIDCGYDQNGASGCNGASPHAYAKTWSDGGLGLAHEAQYGYQDTASTYVCPTLAGYNIGAMITSNYYTYSADEDLLKTLVYQYGAVIAAVQAEGAFSEYSSGVFAGCDADTSIDHAITVVGYGTEDGVDYWLIKNSWGSDWGEDGYIKLKRGVGMCSIGTLVAVPICTAVSGATDAPMTTTTAAAPCEDYYSNCGDYASYCDVWGDSFTTACPVTCNTC